MLLTQRYWAVTYYGGNQSIAGLFTVTLY